MRPPRAGGLTAVPARRPTGRALPAEGWTPPARPWAPPRAPPPPAGPAASATITAAIGCAMGGPFTIEVGFLVWKIAAALNGYRRHVRDSSFVVDFAAAFY